MSDLYTSPSFHQISPLTRSRSDVRSQALKRSNSFAGLIRMPSFSLPSYGYGGGFMARSLSRSGRDRKLLERPNIDGVPYSGFDPIYIVVSVSGILFGIMLLVWLYKG